MISQIQNLSNQRKGVTFAVIAHLIWGAMASYLGLIRTIDPLEIAVHRGLWSIPIAGLVVWRMGLVEETIRVLRNGRYMAILALTSAIIVFNWTIYIWCIEHGRTLDASLGYFINPLMNVAVGFIFLRERFTPPQMLAIGLAVVAVLVETIATGVFPAIGLSLAGTFCLYGLFRKMVPVSPVTGFFIEVLIIALPLLALDYWVASHGGTHFGTSTFNTLMLMGCGAFTSGALIFYALSLKLLRYSTAGLLQYISPSLVFLTAIFVFGEKLDPWKLAAFAIIWLALAIYSWSSLRMELQPAS